MKKTNVYKIAYILFFVLLIPTTVVILYSLSFVKYSYGVYVTMNRLYELLVSNIGITAVIAVAGLGLFSVVGRDNKEISRFLIIIVSVLLLDAVFILGFCHFTGVTTLINYMDQYIYHGPTMNEMAEGYGELYDPSDGNIVYSGYFKGNQYNGYGVLYDSEDGHRFVSYFGEFKNGQFSGNGYWFNYKSDYKDGPGWNNMIDHNGNKVKLTKKEMEIVRSIGIGEDDLKHIMLVYKGEFKSNKYNGEEQNMHFLMMEYTLLSIMEPLLII